MKESYYFSHDYNARNDPKMVKLQMALGHEGKGIYWDLIEMMYEQEGYLLLSECECYAFALRADSDKVKAVLLFDGLFKNDAGKIYSESILKRLEKRESKSKIASDNAYARWDKYKRNAGAMQTQCNGNAIKDNKEKDIKEKDNKENNSLYFTDFKKLEKEMLTSQTWMESVCMKYSLELNQVTKKLSDFIIHLKTQGETGKDLLDAKRYFSNWLGKNLPEGNYKTPEKLKFKMPNHFSYDYYDSLSDIEQQNYEKHLKSLGLKKITDELGNLTDYRR